MGWSVWILLIGSLVIKLQLQSVIAACPSYSIPENVNRPFMDVASTDTEATCTATSADPSFLCDKALDGDLSTSYKVKSPDLSIGSSIDITFGNWHIINTVKILQLTGSATPQIKQVKISFKGVSSADVHVNLTQNIAPRFKPDMVTFSERLANGIQITIESLYDGTTGHGYQSVEVGNTMAIGDKLCEYFTLDASKTSSPIGVYSDTSLLGAMATELHAILSLNSNSTTPPRYVLKFGASSNTKLILDRYGPPGANVVGVTEAVSSLHATKWRQFGVDFTGSKIAVNIGNTSLFHHDEASEKIQVNYVSFYNPGSTVAKVLYCNREVNCYKEASHFWPLDKPILNDYVAGESTITKNSNIRPGPAANLVTSGAINLKNNVILLGDFANKCISNPKLCPKGLTVSLWLQMNTGVISSSLHYILSSGHKTSIGVQIFFKDDKIFGLLRDGSIEWTASLPVKKGVWHQVTMSWSTSEGLYLMVDYSSHALATSTALIKATDDETFLTLGVLDNVGSADASVSSLVIWYKRLEQYQVQKIGLCSELANSVPPINKDSVYRYVPFDLIKVSSEKTGTLKKSLLSFNDGTFTSGGWQPTVSTSQEYIQFDLVIGSTVTEFLTSGGNNIAQWVTGFKLSYSLDGIRWKQYQINSTHSTLKANSDQTSITSNTICPGIEARFVRIYPVTWNTGITMRIGVSYSKESFLYKGCYSSGDLDLSNPSNDVSIDVIHPGYCVTSCGIKSFKYAGVTVGSRCYCFNTLPSVTVSRYKCNEPCGGNPAIMCGDQSYVSMYDVKESLNVNFGVTMPTTVNFLNSFKVTSSSHHYYTVDFGEGIVVTTNTSEIDHVALGSNTRNVLSNTWIGQYGVPRQLHTKNSLTVEWALKGSNISYGKVHESYIIIDVKVKEGTELTLTHSSAASAQDIVYHLPDPNVYMTSYATVSQRISTSGPTDTFRTYLLVSNQFGSGALKAFTVEVAKEGYVNLQVYRPVCRQPGESSFCYKDGTCSTAVPLCPSTSSPCTPPKSFCLVSSSCTTSGLLCGEPGGPVADPLAANFQVVYNKLVYLTEGVHTVSTESSSGKPDYNVRLMDVVGVTLPSASSAELYMGASTKRIPFKTGVDMVTGSLLSTIGYNNTALNFEPLVRATYIEPSIFALYHYCGIGRYEDTLNISDSKTFQIHQASYTCNERINNFSYHVPLIVETYQPFNITIYEHSGNNVTHLIQFNYTDNITSFVRRVNRNITYQYRFSTAGNYTVDITALNLLGAVNKRCVMIVQDRVYQVIQHPITPTNLTQLANISWTVVNGTDTHCNVTFGDSTTQTIQTGTFNQMNSFWVTKQYAAVGEYWVNISCGNLVSRQVANTTMVIIEIPIEAISCALSLSTVEVNQSLTVQAAVKNTVTNSMARFHFGDGTFNETRNYRLISPLIGPTVFAYEMLKYYSTWGIFLPNITVFNNVSYKTCVFNVNVLKPVYPIVISSLTATDANITTPTAFMMNISSGNDFECNWNFGNLYTRINGSGFYNLGTYVYYTYSSVKCYTVTVTCKNRLYTGSGSTIACVYYPITGLVLTAPAVHDFHLNCPVSFSMSRGTKVSFEVQWITLLTMQTANVTINSMSSNGISTTGSLSVQKRHFPANGVYMVVLSAVNKVTPRVVRTKIIYVEIPIANFITASSHVYIQVNHTVKLYSSVTSGSNITVNWDFKDGTVNQTRFYVMDTFKLSRYNVSHVYTDHGLYRVRCTASNRLGSLNTFTNIYVQYPVLNLTVKTNSPQIIPAGTTTFILTVPDSIHVPTDAFIDVDFEANSNFYRLSFGTLKLCKFTKTITTPGRYNVTITVYNQISSQQMNTTIDVQREIKGLVVTAVHTAGDPGFGAPGRGINQNVFPREYPVRFNAATSDGSNITYYIDYGDGSGVNVTQQHYSMHQYNSKGHYTIAIIANNSVSTMNFKVQITIMDSNLGLVFGSDCPTWFPLTTTFQVSLTQVGTDGCCLVDLLNGTYFIYKENPSTICRADWASLTKTHNVFPAKHNTSVSFSHTYRRKQYYYVKTSCHNTVSYLERYHWVILVPLPCGFPRILLKDIGLSYTRPKRYVQSKPMKVYSDASVSCYASRKTEFIWRLSTTNSTGHPNSVVPLPKNGITNRSILELPARSLPLGIYKLALNVSVVNLALVDMSSAGYVEIVPTPLQCFVYGGNGWSQSVHRELTVDAGHSFDPDEAQENRLVGLEFYLYCKKNASSNFTFPDNPATDTTEQARGGGGCTTRDAGFVSKNFTIKVFQKNTFKENDSLHFRLYCRKGSRLGHFDLFVKMTDKDPPQCSLRMDGMTLNRQVVTSTKATIKSTCNIHNGSESNLVFKWSLSKMNNLSQYEDQNLDDFLQSPANGKDLVIRKNSLGGCSIYRVDLEVRFTGRPSGYTYLLLNTHCPPRGGICSATPTKGVPTALFTIKCENWTNYEGGDQLQYHFYYKTKPYHLPLLFLNTEKTLTENVTLPEGHQVFGYNVEILVTIVDDIGASTSTNFKVKIQPGKEVEEFPCTFLRKDVLEKNGHLVNLEMNDNSQALNKWCLKQTEKLNKEAKDRVANVRNLTTYLNEIRSFLETETTPATEHPKAAEARLLEKQISDINYVAKNCCQIRERIAMSLFNTQLDSITTIQMTSATVFSLTGNPQEQCMETLIWLTAVLKRIADFFVVETSNSNFADVRDGMASLFQASAGVLNGFSVALEKASQQNTTNDPQKAEIAMFYSNYVQDLIVNTTKVLRDCCIVSNEFPTEIFTPELNVTFSRNTLNRVDNFSLYTGSGKILLPDTWRSDVFGNDYEENREVETQATVFQSNPFTGDNSSKLVHSMVCDFTLSNTSGEIKLQNLTKTIEIWIHKKGSLANCYKGRLSHQETQYHQFQVSRNESSINVDVRELLEPGQKSVQPEFSISLREGKRPSNDDIWYNLPGLDASKQPVHTQFYPSHMTNNTMAGQYFVAVKYNRSLSQASGNQERNFSLCIYTSECIYWDTTMNVWTGEGCQAGPGSNLTHTQCLCSHATSFGSDFVVPPNKIDWDKINLSELLNNFLVAGVLLSAIGIYLLLLIPTRRQDIKDLEKLGVIPIPSNDPRDTFGYEVCFYTGFKPGSGTTAKVSIILSGSKDSTQPRILEDVDKSRKLFQRGTEDSFLVTTPYDIGQLGSVRIWHNFGGDNPSWFLSRMYIRDLQTNTKTWYVCNRWLAVEEDDGKIDRVLHPASNQELTSFDLLFETETRKNFSDSHIWFSVYYRPPQSTFTRVQRMTCCLCIMLSTMLANAMFYQTGGDTPNAEVVIGPFRLSTQQISIAITSSLVVLPMNVLIINLFRKSRPKNPPGEEKTKRFLNKTTKKSESGTEQTFDQEDELENDHVYETLSVESESQANKESEKDEEEIKKEKSAEMKQPSTLPYWCIYIAYVLAFITCAVSTTFTIFYSLTFGKEKSEGWLTAMMISFWQDVLISQPIKVLALAILVALIIKDPSKVDDGTKRSAELGHDEEWIHRESEGNEKVRLQNFVPKPPTEDVLYESRQILIKQKEMKAIIKEIVVYFIYLMVLCFVAYGGVDPQSYQISEATKAMFMEGSYAGGEALTSVTEPVNYWKWLHSTVIPTLKPKYWYGPHDNNEESHMWTEDHIKRKSRRGWKVKIHKRVLGGGGGGEEEEEPNDLFANITLHKFPTNVIADRGTAFIIGSARLRQLRVQPGGCAIHPAFHGRVYSCSSPYTWEKEDESPHLPGWEPVNASVAKDLAKDKKSSWTWKTAWELQGSPYWGQFATYWGGGYVANIDPSRLQTVEEMQSLELDMWIDRYTRAVFTEFALYNAYTNFFCVITILTEILPTGGYNHYAQFRPIRLYRYTGPESYVLMAFELVYIIFLFMFTYSEFKELYRRKKKYFEDPWNYLEILVILLSFTTIGLFFARLAFGKYAVNRMNDNPGDFISFTYVLLLDESQIATLGYAVFFNILKSLRFLRFNRRLSLLTRTIKACAAPLLSFFFMFIIVFLAYVQFAFAVFGPVEEMYSSFTTCLSTMLSMTLGGFDFQTLMSVNRLLGPMFFFSYMLFVFMILVNVFVSIINDELAEVKSDVELQPNDYEIMDYVVHQIKMAAGVRVGPAVKPLYKDSKSKFQLEVESIESLSENIEYALVNTIVEDQRQTNWLKRENLTRKKIILLREVLRRNEDYDEDDLANLIPLMEKFLMKHTDKEVARIVLDRDDVDIASLDDVVIRLTNDSESSSRYQSLSFSCQNLYEKLTAQRASDKLGYDNYGQSTIDQLSIDSNMDSSDSDDGENNEETLVDKESCVEDKISKHESLGSDADEPSRDQFVSSEVTSIYSLDDKSVEEDNEQTPSDEETDELDNETEPNEDDEKCEENDENEAPSNEFENVTPSPETLSTETDEWSDSPTHPRPPSPKATTVPTSESSNEDDKSL